MCKLYPRVGLHLVKQKRWKNIKLCKPCSHYNNDMILRPLLCTIVLYWSVKVMTQIWIILTTAIKHWEKRKVKIYLTMALKLLLKWQITGIMFNFNSVPKNKWFEESAKKDKKEMILSFDKLLSAKQAE